jgi:hypothetical protein
VADAAWVRACAKLIEEEGAQQFLVNLLYVLRDQSVKGCIDCPGGAEVVEG